jgi:hypothetical protein
MLDVGCWILDLSLELTTGTQRKAECKMQNVQCKMKNAEVGFRIEHFAFFILH